MNWSCLNLFYQRALCLGGPRKGTTTIGQNNRDLGPSKYETGLLTARPGCPSSTIVCFCKSPFSGNAWLLYESILVRVCSSLSQNWYSLLNTAYTDFPCPQLDASCVPDNKIPNSSLSGVSGSEVPKNKMNTIRYQVYQGPEVPKNKIADSSLPGVSGVGSSKKIKLQTIRCQVYQGSEVPKNKIADNSLPGVSGVGSSKKILQTIRCQVYQGSEVPKNKIADISLPGVSGVADFPKIWEPPGRSSVIGVATRYGLDGPGILSLWRRGFPNPSRPALEPTQPPVQWVPGHSLG